MSDDRHAIEPRPARGYTREPFKHGNTLGLKHGGFVSPLRLQPRAEEIAEALRPVVPGYCEAFEPMVGIAATFLARAEVGLAAIARLDDAAANELAPYTVADAAKLGRLREDVRGWLNSARRTLNDL